jgi:hypothetical protein
LVQCFQPIAIFVVIVAIVVVDVSFFIVTVTVTSSFLVSSQDAEFGLVDSNQPLFLLNLLQKVPLSIGQREKRHSYICMPVSVGTV